ncbi:MULTISPECIES: 3-deoxy-manno-octulosonate cytidylyltransferase [unclassified Moraxella]|uniref:3-deoxy-manno-octulosonate cytidylyltransferase n=1 Tax=unclassified Moraxella TaxID=2685852 RepID=UPI003AF55F66
MNKHLVIPARLKSTRLPNKPLLEIHDKPMILWVIDRAVAVQQAGIADDIFVATDSQAIADICQDYCQNNQLAVQVIMTSPDHASGTDRLAEVAQQLNWSPQDIVINMQGDEPLVPKSLIAQVTELLLQKTDCVMATLAEPILTFEEFYRPSVVKVVKTVNNEALYFSRSPIPCDRDIAMNDTPPVMSDKPNNALRHLGLYAYRVNLLQQFGSWQQGKLEQLESLEQLRIMEHGFRIAIDVASVQLPAGVDTQGDLDRLNMMDLTDFLAVE